MHSRIKSHIVLFEIIILIFTVSIQSASIKSPYNKYAFSFDYMDTIQKIVLSGEHHFWSLPNSVVLPNRPFLSFLYKSNTIESDIYSIFSYENRNHEYYPNFFLGSVISYESPHIRGGIQFDFHTTNVYKSTDLADTLNDIKMEQVVSGYDHISGSGKNKDFNFQYGFVELLFGNFSLLTGKYPLRWGPGYKGTLGLSGTTLSPFYYYLLQLDINKTIHASAFLNGFDDSYLFVKDTMLNPDRFCAGQRLDIRFGDHLQLGMYEFVSFNGTSLLPRFANPVQFYYITNHLGGGIAERRNNIMGGIDCNVLISKLRIYGEFLNDDITVFDDNGSPNKFGFQVGCAYYGLNSLQEIGAEFTHVSRWTYGHWAPGLNRYTYFQESRGWPWGNDQDLWHLHALVKLPFKLKLYTELNLWIKGDGTLDEYHWDIPDSLRPDMDNVGGMVDYISDNKLLNLSYYLCWSPKKWIDINISWLPSFYDRSVKNRFTFNARVNIPAVAMFNLNKNSITSNDSER